MVLFPMDSLLKGDLREIKGVSQRTAADIPLVLPILHISSILPVFSFSIFPFLPPTHPSHCYCPSYPSTSTFQSFHLSHPFCSSHPPVLYNFPMILPFLLLPTFHPILLLLHLLSNLPIFLILSVFHILSSLSILPILPIFILHSFPSL